MLKLQILCGSAFFKSSPPAREDFLGQGMSETREIPRGQRNARRFGSNSRKLECDVRKVSHEIVVPYRQTIGAGRFIDNRGPFDTRPVPMNLHHPAPIGGPEKSGASGTISLVAQAAA